MKKLVLLSLFLISISLLKAQADEKNTTEILKVVKLYLTVTDNLDSTAILKAFHPDAKLMSVTKSGELKKMTLYDWWSRISRIPNPKVRKSKIDILDISGISAVVRVEFEKSTDLLSLLKINNEWKIINKTLSIVL